jgi:hypothetical protein
MTGEESLPIVRPQSIDSIFLQEIARWSFLPKEFVQEYSCSTEWKRIISLVFGLYDSLGKFKALSVCDGTLSER